MAKLVSSKIFQQTLRNFSYASTLRNKREGRFMTKIMKGVSVKRKWNFDSVKLAPVIFNAENLSKGASEGKRSVNVRRTAVLNKLFMRHITDLMATGDNASEFLGKGIEINRVMVTPDFKGVNVFWIAKGTEDDDKIESLLAKNAGTLRHELSQLRVIGMVPKIYFIKDKQYAKSVEVDLRLARADFGQDYCPVELPSRLRSELSLTTQIPSYLKDKIVSTENEAEEEFDDAPLPPMSMDVLGLNHSGIMQKVQQLKKKAQALHRKNTENKEDIIPTTYNDDPVIFENQKKQKEAFQQFLLKRQVLKAKANRLKNKSYPEYEYLRMPQGEILDDSALAKELLESERDYIEEIEEDVK